MQERVVRRDVVGGPAVVVGGKTGERGRRRCEKGLDGRRTEKAPQCSVVEWTQPGVGNWDRKMGERERKKRREERKGARSSLLWKGGRRRRMSGVSWALRGGGRQRGNGRRQETGATLTTWREQLSWQRTLQDGDRGASVDES